MSQSSSISIWFTQDGILVKVVGKGVVEYCRNLKDEIDNLISEYTKFNLYFDLSETKHMDSTFIGLLVMLDKKVTSSAKGNLYILNPSTRIIEILATMDLLDILKITNASVNIIGKYKDVSTNIQMDIVEIKLLIDTHNSLIQTNLRNKEKFEALEKALKEELKRYEERQKSLS